MLLMVHGLNDYTNKMPMLLTTHPAKASMETTIGCFFLPLQKCKRIVKRSILLIWLDNMVELKLFTFHKFLRFCRSRQEPYLHL
jgi:hypothetical protein